MDMTVLIEPHDGGFKASTSQPVAMETEGASAEEAVERLRALAASRLSSGELVSVSLPIVDSIHPWMKFAGVWKDHPDLDQFIQSVTVYRRSADATESDN